MYADKSQRYLESDERLRKYRPSWLSTDLGEEVPQARENVAYPDYQDPQARQSVSWPGVQDGGPTPSDQSLISLAQPTIPY